MQKRPIIQAKETCKSGVCAELYTAVQRDLVYMQKRPIIQAKETCKSGVCAELYTAVAKKPRVGGD
jgi:hypothetical protein